jgi:hypothetical protein
MKKGPRRPLPSGQRGVKVQHKINNTPQCKILPVYDQLFVAAVAGVRAFLSTISLLKGRMQFLLRCTQTWLTRVSQALHPRPLPALSKFHDYLHFLLFHIGNESELMDTAKFLL